MDVLRIEERKKKKSKTYRCVGPERITGSMRVLSFRSTSDAHYALVCENCAWQSEILVEKRSN